MSSIDPLEVVKEHGVIPTVSLPSAEVALPLCGALIEGGLPILEIMFRSDLDAVTTAIEQVRAEFPDFCVGVGTVTDTEQVLQAKAAGASFAASSGLHPVAVQLAAKEGLPFWPGVATATEIEWALELGAKVMRFFPAKALGGPQVVSACFAPYLHLGAQIIPMGHVDGGSASQYWGLEGVVAVAGSWVATAELIERGAWGEITQRAAAALQMHKTCMGRKAS
ncbi:MAG: bifunctional 4-hydroxy-2-oxoglutarate aldolase/2-dehydro-3-deoxy-phosphogluconate aldolase [Coriobacteriia bacterium]|nr:bifunctional 4-hydroxy-2-oxoglutarate aldolase/2-dehydro-3-deoxy-phosphogluconate aldolase [Coriobacteriia bacterium]